MGLLVLLLLLALIFGAGTVFEVALNVIVIAMVVTLLLGVLGYAGLRGRTL